MLFYQIINKNKLDTLKKISGFVIVGSSGSGKTTLVNSLRGYGRFSIPQRIITRPQRDNDDLTENYHGSGETINQLDLEGRISLRWKRNMEERRVEEYAFREVETDKIVIYSGNNALFDNSVSILPKGALGNFVMIGVYSSDEDRLARLQERSPDLFKKKVGEMEYRMSDLSENIKKHVDVLFYNEQDLEDSCSAFRELIETLIK